jgi:hypothetical protein
LSPFCWRAADAPTRQDDQLNEEINTLYCVCECVCLAFGATRQDDQLE